MQTLVNRRKMMIVLVACIAASAIVYMGFGSIVLPSLAQPASDSGAETATYGQEADTPRLPIRLPGWLADFRSDRDLRHRPLLAFRIWANQPKRYLPSFLFCLATSICAWALLPGRLSAARTTCARRFWRSMFIGVFVCLMTVLYARALFATGIGTPLAFLLLAALELGLLLGLSLIISVIGKAVFARITFMSPGLLDKRPIVKCAIELTTGAALIGCLLLIPGFFGLPRIGVRLVALLCGLGFGACLIAARTSCAGNDGTHENMGSPNES